MEEWKGKTLAMFLRRGSPPTSRFVRRLLQSPIVPERAANCKLGFAGAEQGFEFRSPLSWGLG